MSIFFTAVFGGIAYLLGGADYAFPVATVSIVLCTISLIIGDTEEWIYVFGDHDES